MAIESSEDLGCSVLEPALVLHMHEQPCSDTLHCRTHIYTPTHPQTQTRGSQPIGWTQDGHALTHKIHTHITG